MVYALLTTVENHTQLQVRGGKNDTGSHMID